jgi:hypothetical protein
MDDDDFCDFSSPGQFKAPPKKEDNVEKKVEKKQIKIEVDKEFFKQETSAEEPPATPAPSAEEIPKTSNSELEKQYKAMSIDAIRDLAKSLGISHIENRKRKTKSTLIVDIIAHS